MLRNLVRSTACEPSFRVAAEAVAELAKVILSDRIARELSEPLRAERVVRVERLRSGTFEPRPVLAVVQVDGGRLRLRGRGEGPGTRRAAWRED